MSDFVLPDAPGWTEHVWTWGEDGPLTEATDGSPMRVDIVTITEFAPSGPETSEPLIEARGFALTKAGKRDRRSNTPSYACKAWRDAVLAQYLARRAAG